MSIRVVNWAFNLKVGSSSVKLVLLKLADNANDEGYCWPSVDYICRHTELSKTTVKAAIKKLAEAGLLRIEHRRADAVSLSNVYWLEIDRVGQQPTQGGKSSAEITGGVGREPTPNRQKIEPSIEPKTELEGFEDFWKAYPKKIAKVLAEKAWNKLRPTKELSNRILEALHKQKASADWTKNEGQYIPHPSTWLNGHRWEDEINTESEPEEPIRTGVWAKRL